MEKVIKITGIKKAVGEYKDWLSRDNRHTATIMLDKGTGDVWTDCFIDCNSWKEYHDSDIISLSRYIGERNEDRQPITMALIREYAQMAMEKK